MWQGIRRHLVKISIWMMKCQPKNAKGVCKEFVSMIEITCIPKLIVLRLRFVWWQLHPLGYPLAGYYHFDKLWFPFFISWVLKWAILKHGGIQAYRKAFPLFLGLVLGEFTMGSIWGLVGLLTGKPTYTFKSW